MRTPMYKTDNLIPTNGVYVTETFGPKGWQAASYDADGMASDIRWFPTYQAATEYAHRLDGIDPELMEKVEFDPLQGADRRR
jgi:hypothetical protein